MISSPAKLKSPTSARLDFKSVSIPGSSLETKLDGAMAKYATWILGAIVLYFFAYHVLFIYPRHVWYDELTTYYVARTFSWSSVTEAIRLTADAQPPTYHLLQMP